VDSTHTLAAGESFFKLRLAAVPPAFAASFFAAGLLLWLRAL
jgi:hypothetical protein